MKEAYGDVLNLFDGFVVNLDLTTKTSVEQKDFSIYEVSKQLQLK